MVSTFTPYPFSVHTARALWGSLLPKDPDQPPGGAFWTILAFLMSVSLATSEQGCVRADTHELLTAQGFP